MKKKLFWLILASLIALSLISAGCLMQAYFENKRIAEKQIKGYGILQKECGISKDYETILMLKGLVPDFAMIELRDSYYRKFYRGIGFHYFAPFIILGALLAYIGLTKAIDLIKIFKKPTTIRSV